MVGDPCLHGTAPDNCLACSQEELEIALRDRAHDWHRARAEKAEADLWSAQRELKNLARERDDLRRKADRETRKRRAKHATLLRIQSLNKALESELDEIGRVIGQGVDWAQYYRRIGRRELLLAAKTLVAKVEARRGLLPAIKSVILGTPSVEVHERIQNLESSLQSAWDAANYWAQEAQSRYDWASRWKQIAKKNHQGTK